MKSFTILTTAVVLGGFAMSFAVPVLADDPPVEGSECVSGCSLQNNNWSFGAPVELGSESFVYKDTSEDEINQANVASGGKASDKNQSNFLVETTTVIDYTVSTTSQDHINPGNQVNNQPGGGPKITETTTIDSESTSTTKSHIKPSKP
jgi:hypothetical protein